MDVSVSYSTITCTTELPVILHDATELPLHRLYQRPTLGYGESMLLGISVYFGELLNL